MGDAPHAGDASLPMGGVLRHICHDLRSPLIAALSSLRSFADVDQNAPLSSAQVQSRIATALAAAELMEGVVNNMLDFEALQSGRTSVHYGCLRPSQVMGGVGEAFATLALSKGVALDVAPPPAELESTVRSADLRLLRTCLHTGIANALAFTPEGGRVRVSVRSSADDPETFLVCVEDTGVGAGAALMEQLRQGGAFRHLTPGQLGGHGGAGLGIAIARRLLSMHRGSSLRLHSDGEGKGFAFTMAVHAPLVCSSALAAPLVASAYERFAAKRSVSLGAEPTGAAALGLRVPAAEAELPAGTGAADEEAIAEALHVLHVDDDPLMLLTMPATVFDPLGCLCEQARCGADALALVAERAVPYDVIVLDNQMPQMTGAEVARALRARGCESLLVGLTADPPGSADREEFEACLDVCADKDTFGLERVRSVLRARRAAGARQPAAVAEAPAASEPSEAQPGPTARSFSLRLVPNHADLFVELPPAGAPPLATSCSTSDSSASSPSHTPQQRMSRLAGLRMRLAGHAGVRGVKPTLGSKGDAGAAAGEGGQQQQPPHRGSELCEPPSWRVPGSQPPSPFDRRSAGEDLLPLGSPVFSSHTLTSVPKLTGKAAGTSPPPRNKWKTARLAPLGPQAPSAAVAQRQSLFLL